MNLPALEVPQLGGFVDIIFQHDVVAITTTSQRSNSAALYINFDPDNAMLRWINDEDRINEPEASLALIANEPEGRALINPNLVTFWSSKVLPNFKHAVPDDKTLLITPTDTDNPLHGDKLNH